MRGKEQVDKRGIFQGFSNAKKNTWQPDAAVVPCAVFYGGVDVFFFISYGNRPFQNGTLIVLLSQILHPTASDSRQDGHFIPLHHQLVAGSARNEEL